MFPLFLYGFTDWAVLVLRLVLGLILITHGVARWRRDRGGKRVLGFLEFASGTAITLGFLTALFAMVLAVEFVVTLAQKSLKAAPLSAGYEFDLLILAALIMLLALGAGPYSLDRMLFWGL